MKKRMLTFALALALCLGLLPSAALAAENDFEIKDGVLTRYRGSGGNVVVPDGVTEIGIEAFANCKEPITVTVPAGVTKLAPGAFGGSETLTGVTLPNSITELGISAFHGCTDLKSITIPGSVTKLGWAAFMCSGLTDVAIPDSVTMIDGFAFYGCTDLKSVTIGKGVTEIGWRTFDYLPSLTDVYYTGTQEQWNCIRVGKDNYALDKTTIHFSDGTSKVPVPAAETTSKPGKDEPEVQKFADVTPDKWYYEAVNSYAKTGILKGRGDGLFHPDDYVTNGEFATILCRVSEQASEDYKLYTNPESGTYYHPNPANWAELACMSCRSGNRLTQMFGCSSDDAADLNYVNAPTTRHRVFYALENLAYDKQFMFRYNYPDFLYNSTTLYYPDLMVTNGQREQAKQALADWDSFSRLEDESLALYALGIIHGDGNGYIHPKDPITRAEVCQILYNMGATRNFLEG